MTPPAVNHVALSERSRITVSLFLAVIGFVVSGAIWIGTLSARVEQAEKAIDGQANVPAQIARLDEKISAFIELYRSDRSRNK